MGNRNRARDDRFVNKRRNQLKHVTSFSTSVPEIEMHRRKVGSLVENKVILQELKMHDLGEKRWSKNQCITRDS